MNMIELEKLLYAILLLIGTPMMIERLTEGVKIFISKKIKRYGIIKKELSKKLKISIMLVFSITASSVINAKFNLDIMDYNVIQIGLSTYILGDLSSKLHQFINKIKQKRER